MSQHTPGKIWRSALLRLGGSALVLALLFSLLPVDELWQTMRRVAPRAWLVVLAGYTASHLIGVFKWRLMVNLAGAGLDLPQAARCYFAGLFGNIFLPSLVGGDLIRAGLALRLGRSKAGVLLGSLLDRMLDVAALTLVAAAGALLLPGALDPRIASSLRRLALPLALAAAGLAGLAALALRRRFSYRMRRRWVKLRRAARRMAQRPGRVLLALALGVTFQVCLVLLMSRIASACGVFVALPGWLLAYPLAKLAALLPVTQGGIGVREAALAVLLVPFGAAPAQTVAAGLVWETVVITAGLLGGLWSALAGRRRDAGPAGV